jgi:tetratricopeptide (TPR) repeat protein/predicted Ser/Thr protein kinase
VSTERSQGDESVAGSYLGARPEGGSDLGEAALREAIRARMFGSPLQAPFVGRFAILELLGEGGMGTVYAVYDEQLDRRVALKLVKGVQSTTAHQRMLREARAMAKLSHPNVVPVFEVGEHEGQMYLAMEFVKGQTLAQWLEEEKPTWTEVVTTYLQAGRGLCAAHAEGLVHRDFKPQNAVMGADGRVRVLDFGLAATHHDPKQESQDTLKPRPAGAAIESSLTKSGAVLGTPAYMPREQWTAGIVDHRSDQFSFCVSLWEAVYGSRPFSGDTTVEIFGNIANDTLVDPPKSDAPAKLRVVLQRGLRSEPDERWESLEALLSELEGLIDDRPRRTRTLVIGVAAAGASFALGLPAYESWVRDRQTRACQKEAIERTAGLWDPQIRARVETGLLDTGANFASASSDRVLQQVDAYVETLTDVDRRACLAATVEESWTPDDHGRAQWCLAERTRDLTAVLARLQNADPLVAASAVTATAELVRPQQCLDQERLRRLPAPPLDAQRRRTEATRANLAEAWARRATGDLPGGLGRARAVVEQASDDPSLRAEALYASGIISAGLGDFAASEAALLDAFFVASGVRDYETSASTAEALADVIGVELERHGDGAGWARHAKLALDELGVEPSHPRSAEHLSTLSRLQNARGNYQEARTLRMQALDIRERVFGSEHPLVANDLNNLANVESTLGNGQESLKLHQRALAIDEAVYGPEHPRVAAKLGDLAANYIVLGKPDVALEHYERALSLTEAALGSDHPDVARLLTAIGPLLNKTGDPDRAEAALLRALELREASLRHDHPDIGRTLNNLANVYYRAGDYKRAGPLYERALTITQQALAPDHDQVAQMRASLANIAYQAGDFGAARDQHAEVLALFERKFGPKHQMIGMATANLALAYEGLGDYERAATLHERSAEIFEASLGGDHAMTAGAWASVGIAREEGGRLEAAIEAYALALEIFDALDGRQRQEPETRFAYGRALLQAGRGRDAALDLARAAEEELRAGGPADEATLAEVQAWIAEHDR